jgi:hypothetical protein
MKLFQLAKRAAGAIRNVIGRRSSPSTPVPPPPPPVVRSASRQPGPPQPPGPLIPPPRIPRNPSAQPNQPKQQNRTVTPQEQRDVKHVQDVYDKVQLLGRDRSYDSPNAISQLMTQMRRVNSSNVWGYFYELEPGTQKSGILYVTFLAEAPRGGSRPNSAGPTYAYYDVPLKKYESFQRASDSSAGKAVWDYLRVRGTNWDHRYRYKLVQVTGDYIPRKATRGGLRTRHLQNPHAAQIPNTVWSAISRLQRSPNPEIRVYADKVRRLLLQEAGHKRSTRPERVY